MKLNYVVYWMVRRTLPKIYSKNLLISEVCPGNFFVPKAALIAELVIEFAYGKEKEMRKLKTRQFGRTVKQRIEKTFNWPKSKPKK